MARRGAVCFLRQVIELYTRAVHLGNEYLAGRVSMAKCERPRDDDELRLLPLLCGRRAGANQRLVNRIHRHFAEWFLFLTDASVPSSNWQAEQTIRPAVVNRKTWGGNRSESDAKAQGILSSVGQTCKKQAKAALDFVRQTLRAFGNRLLPAPILLGTR